jgi:hypothetical protein
VHIPSAIVFRSGIAAFSDMPNHLTRHERRQINHLLRRCCGSGADLPSILPFRLVRVSKPTPFSPTARSISWVCGRFRRGRAGSGRQGYPLFPAYSPANRSFNGLHAKSKFLADQTEMDVCSSQKPGFTCAISPHHAPRVLAPWVRGSLFR